MHCRSSTASRSSTTRSSASRSSSSASSPRRRPSRPSHPSSSPWAPRPACIATGTGTITSRTTSRSRNSTTASRCRPARSCRPTGSAWPSPRSPIAPRARVAVPLRRLPRVRRAGDARRRSARRTGQSGSPHRPARRAGAGRRRSYIAERFRIKECHHVRLDDRGLPGDRRRRVPGLRPPDARPAPPARDSLPLREAATCTSSARSASLAESRLGRGSRARLGLGRLRPTHNRAVDERYVVVGHGRHYDDVPPNKGIYRGSATETLKAEVVTESFRPQRRDAPRGGPPHRPAGLPRGAGAASRSARHERLGRQRPAAAVVVARYATWPWIRRRSSSGSEPGGKTSRTPRCR